MMAASMDLPSTSSSTIAASSIHGTGAQNFPSALRNGWSAVSGIALGPIFSSRSRASALDKPLAPPSFAGGADLAAKFLEDGGEFVVTIDLTYLCQLLTGATVNESLQAAQSAPHKAPEVIRRAP
jgi:hypothetical protein